jgi:hypothetical protein
MKRLVLVPLLAVFLGFSPLAHAGLVNNGGGLIYDTDLGITWYQKPDNSPMTWDQAMSWAAGLTAGGVTGWRLPSSYPTPANEAGPWPMPSSTITGAEMAHLYYTELGNTTNAFTNKGPFINLGYNFEGGGNAWSSTDITWNPLTGNLINLHDPTWAWYFDFATGYQGGMVKSDDLRAVNTLAVHAGNISAAPVPIPPAVWLLGSGLLGLIGIRRRFKK